ncbi:S46 family peptidase [Flammeovirga sp. EKP202]|uniref:S46 family peptidase n=1 Tax=Flammeovirga sp. EKP202 TaxID=2770592 RepID=UPI00165ED6ED|nr:S46 family peptidase [Flammeovirga sp. EKP202]MBD0404763.1 S46 family peptidase [Flammeovirga sp. EKP202]
MKKWIQVLLVLILSSQVIASDLGPKKQLDEGMWLPMFVSRLNYTDMKKEGLKLTAEEIYSVNNSSLKDAIVHFGGFCTGEIVSDKGLIFTNHHCGYGGIQSVSTVENDYLTNGFFAKSHDEEKPIDGLFVRFLQRMDDVSEKVNKELEGLSGAERAKKAQEVMAGIKAEKEGELNNDSYEVVVKSFFEGNEFYMFVYERYDDIRLVGNPPEAVGKFGGDTDNWMWPRHTGDFSIFRVYASKDNKPAKYSEDNIPYTPKHHLPVSINGVKKDDFAMIMGYPGSTDRYLTSEGVKQQIEVFNPLFVEMRDAILKTWRKHMDADPKVRLQYASKYASTANYWKYFIGQTKGLKRQHVIEKKQAEESKFNTWIAQDTERKKEYGEVTDMLKDGYEGKRDGRVALVLLTQGGFRIEAVMQARKAARFVGEVSAEEVSESVIKDAKASALEQAKGFFKDYDYATDKELAVVLLKKYKEVLGRSENKNLPVPSVYELIEREFNGDYEAYVEKAFTTSVFSDQERMEAFINDPSATIYEEDMLTQLHNEFFQSYLAVAQGEQEAEMKVEDGNRLYVKGIREMNPNKSYYPNANSTMRLTYGTVKDYIPGDAMFYAYYTTSKGLLEKEDPKNHEFVLPKEIKEKVVNKDFGRYADQNGELRIAFITNNDITGGNSGSPVINGNGELIGLAFDGNWEAMSGDIAFEPKLQRCINVDVRYVLWTIDKVYGAKNIVDEMTIVGGKKGKGKAYEELMPAKY